MARKYRLTGNGEESEFPRRDVNRICLAGEDCKNELKLIAPSASVKVELESREK